MYQRLLIFSLIKINKIYFKILYFFVVFNTNLSIIFTNIFLYKIFYIKKV